MAETESDQPQLPKTLVFNDNEFGSEARKSIELQRLVEDYDTRVRDLGRMGITDEDRLAAERRLLVERLIGLYDTECQLGAGYYENLIYSVIRTRLDVHDGYLQAIKRLEADMRNVNNAHGDFDAEVAISDIEALVFNLNDLWTYKMMLSGFGLETEAPEIMSVMIARKFAPKSKAVPLK